MAVTREISKIKEIPLKVLCNFKLINFVDHELSHSEFSAVTLYVCCGSILTLVQILFSFVLN